jgi:hypothetical protein
LFLFVPTPESQIFRNWENLAERGDLNPQLSRKARFTREIAAISFSTANFKIARVKCCEVP